MKSLIKKRFGKLVVLDYCKKPDHIKNRSVWVSCKCDCGTIKPISKHSLVHKKTRSCGCLNKQRGPNCRYWKGYGEISLNCYSSIRRTAMQRGIKFSVSIEYLWNLFLKQNRKCALSGLDITFDVLGDRKSRQFKETCKITSSLDRIDSSIGYVEGNVQWVHKHINIMKFTLDQKYFIELCKLVSNNDQ